MTYTYWNSLIDHYALASGDDCQMQFWPHGSAQITQIDIGDTLYDHITFTQNDFIHLCPGGTGWGPLLHAYITENRSGTPDIVYWDSDNSEDYLENGVSFTYECIPNERTRVNCSVIAVTDCDDGFNNACHEQLVITNEIAGDVGGPFPVRVRTNASFTNSEGELMQVPISGEYIFYVS